MRGFALRTRDLAAEKSRLSRELGHLSPNNPAHTADRTRLRRQISAIDIERQRLQSQRQSLGRAVHPQAETHSQGQTASLPQNLPLHQSEPQSQPSTRLTAGPAAPPAPPSVSDLREDVLTFLGELESILSNTTNREAALRTVTSMTSLPSPSGRLPI